ncbi:MAG: MBL fold metallo-hydrolase [Fibrobacterota bacterium]
MKIKIWGSRGSHPVPGKDTVRYGGNTSCVTVSCSDGRNIILDAGTGIKNFGNSVSEEILSGKKMEFDLLVSHTHWDHIQGFLYFLPAFMKGVKINVYGLSNGEMGLKEVFTGQTFAHYHPIPMHSFLSDLQFFNIMENTEFSIGDILCRSCLTNHPGRAVGYRLEEEGKSLVYIPDSAPFRDILLLDSEFVSGYEKKKKEDVKKAGELEAYRGKFMDLISGADILIMDSFFKEEENMPHFGHCTYKYTVKTAVSRDVGKLLLFHHSPRRTDSELDLIVKEFKEAYADCHTDIEAAYEGMELEI